MLLTSYQLRQPYGARGIYVIQQHLRAHRTADMPSLPLGRPYLAVIFIATWVHNVACLWPMPRFYQSGSTPLALASTFGIDVKISNVPNDLTEAVTRTLSYLKTDQLERLVVGRGAADVARVKNAKQLKSLELHLALGAAKARSISTEAIAPLGSRREEYTLTIPTTGAPAILSANSTLGLFRGLTTFEQLWYTAENISYTLEAPMDIIDSPAFVSYMRSCAGEYTDNASQPYRGFMLDTARNLWVHIHLFLYVWSDIILLSFPVLDIKRTLDAMSWAKVNTRVMGPLSCL